MLHLKHYLYTSPDRSKTTIRLNVHISWPFQNTIRLNAHISWPLQKYYSSQCTHFLTIQKTLLLSMYTSPDHSKNAIRLNVHISWPFQSTPFPDLSRGKANDPVQASQTKPRMRAKTVWSPHCGPYGDQDQIVKLLLKESSRSLLSKHHPRSVDARCFGVIAFFVGRWPQQCLRYPKRVAPSKHLIGSISLLTGVPAVQIRVEPFLFAWDFPTCWQ